VPSGQTAVVGVSTGGWGCSPPPGASVRFCAAARAAARAALRAAVAAAATAKAAAACARRRYCSAPAPSPAPRGGAGAGAPDGVDRAAEAAAVKAAPPPGSPTRDNSGAAPGSRIGSRPVAIPFQPGARGGGSCIAAAAEGGLGGAGPKPGLRFMRQPAAAGLPSESRGPGRGGMTLTEGTTGNGVIIRMATAGGARSGGSSSSAEQNPGRKVDHCSCALPGAAIMFMIFMIGLRGGRRTTAPARADARRPGLHGRFRQRFRQRVLQTDFCCIILCQIYYCT
jgi:hypothetical protein